MIKIYFKNGVNASPVDWTPYLVQPSPLKRSIESDTPNECGVISFDSLSVKFIYKFGNAVYNAFSGNLTNADKYIFQICMIKPDSTEKQIFEGIADFESIEWSDFEDFINFDIVDKMAAFQLLSNTVLQRGVMGDAVKDRLNYTGDYAVQFAKFSHESIGSAYLIGLKEIVDGELGNDIVQSAPVLVKGDTFRHPYPVRMDETFFVIDSGTFGGDYWVKIHKNPIASLVLDMLLADNDSEGKNYIHIQGDVLKKWDYILIGNGALEKKYHVVSDPVLNATLKTVDTLPETGEAGWIYFASDEISYYVYYGSEWVWIGDKDAKFYRYQVQQEETSNVDWYRDSLITLFENDISVETGFYLNHLYYFPKNYYGENDICLYQTDFYNRSVVKSFDALKILKGLIDQAWPGITIINNSGALTFPIALFHYKTLLYGNPFDKQPYEAIKFLSDSMQCYFYFNMAGEFVIQSKGAISENNSHSIPDIYYSGDKKFFWDKVSDGVKVTVKTGIIVNDVDFSGVAELSFVADKNIQPRNQIEIEIFAPPEVIPTSLGLNDYAELVAQDVIDFYGKRHYFYDMLFPLDDDMLEWEILDMLVINSVNYFITGLEIDPISPSLRVEAVSLAGYTYLPGNAVIPKRETQTSGGAGTTIQNITQSTTTNNYTGGAIPVGTQPVFIIPKTATLSNMNAGSLALGTILANNELETIKIRITAAITGLTNFYISDGIATIATFDVSLLGENDYVTEIEVNKKYTSETTITAHFSGTVSVGEFISKIKVLGTVTT